MTFKYVNRKNLVYYLFEKKHENGASEYLFSRQQQHNDINEIPEGYQIYEDFSGKVILKRVNNE